MEMLYVLVGAFAGLGGSMMVQQLARKSEIEDKLRFAYAEWAACVEILVHASLLMTREETGTTLNPDVTHQYVRFGTAKHILLFLDKNRERREEIERLSGNLPWIVLGKDKQPPIRTLNHAEGMERATELKSFLAQVDRQLSDESAY